MMTITKGKTIIRYNIPNWVVDLKFNKENFLQTLIWIDVLINVDSLTTGESFNYAIISLHSWGLVHKKIQFVDSKGW